MDFENDEITHIVTDYEILSIGLVIGGYSDAQIQRCGADTKQYRFKITHGISLLTMCVIYEDLQQSNAVDNTTNPSRPMRLKGSETNLKWFLRAVYYLRNYPTEEGMVRSFNVNRGWARKSIWGIIEKIQYLKSKKNHLARRFRR